MVLHKPSFAYHIVNTLLTSQTTLLWKPCSHTKRTTDKSLVHLQYCAYSNETSPSFVQMLRAVVIHWRQVTVPLFGTRLSATLDLHSPMAAPDKTTCVVATVNKRLTGAGALWKGRDVNTDDVVFAMGQRHLVEGRQTMKTHLTEWVMSSSLLLVTHMRVYNWSYFKQLRCNDRNQ